MLHDVAGLDELLYGVGDFKLVSPRRFDLSDRIEYRGGKKVHAHERKIAFRRFRLLNELYESTTRFVKLGDAVPFRLRDALKRNHGVARSLIELSDQRGNPVAEDVVAEVDDERVLTHKVLGARDRVRDPERRALIDVGDVHAVL